MKKKRVSILGISLFCCACSLAQGDSLYIGKYKHTYGATTSLSQSFLSLNYEEGKKELSFEPNRPLNIGLAFAWKNSSLSYSHGFSGMRDKEKGKSSTVDFQYHVMGKKFIIDFYFQQYKGFYRYDSEQQKYLSFDDLRINLYGGKFTYVFNSDKFSIGAAHNKNRIQKKSAGALLIGGSSFLSVIKNTPELMDGIRGNDSRSFSFGPTIGYGYNWVLWKKFLASLSFSVGINGIFDENLSTKNTVFYVNGQVGSELNLAYQGEEWGLGIKSSLSAMYFEKVENYTTQLSNKHVSFFVTKRFSLKKDPKILQYDLIDLLDLSTY
ncbi:DUF4421 family protein [Myroides odoratus]|uniref:DUF4421 family protein n=1 Tax=Myroides odoratus TaxID=256 RepID=UPI0039B09F14